MAAPKYNKIPKKEGLNSSSEKEQVKLYQDKLKELLKNKDMAKKAALIIEQMLANKK